VDSVEARGGARARLEARARVNSAISVEALIPTKVDPHVTITPVHGEGLALARGTPLAKGARDPRVVVYSIHDM